MTDSTNIMAGPFHGMPSARNRLKVGMRGKFKFNASDHTPHGAITEVTSEERGDEPPR